MPLNHAGTYTLKGHITVHANTELRGVNGFPYRSWGSTNATNQGTTLQAFEGAGCTDPASAAPFVHLQGSNAGISGMSIVYPAQAGPEAAEPVPYPWCTPPSHRQAVHSMTLIGSMPSGSSRVGESVARCLVYADARNCNDVTGIRGSGDDVTIKNMFLVNPYLGIDLGTVPAGRHLVDDVYGNPLYIGIFVDQCFDVGRIRHIHFWNFWANDMVPNKPGGPPKVVGPLQRWVSTHGVTIKLARTDWEVLEDVFSWGYSTGLLLTNSTVLDPTTNTTIGAFNGQCTDIQFDAVDVGIDVEATDPYGVFFSNLNLANAGCWQDPPSGCSQVGIRCKGNGCQSNVVVRGASFWGAFKQAVVWSGPGFFTISDSTVESWDPKGPAAIEASAGRIGIRGCTFGTATPSPGAVAVLLGADVSGAVVTANDLLGSTVNASQMHQNQFVITANLP